LMMLLGPKGSTRPNYEIPGGQPPGAET